MNRVPIVDVIYAFILFVTFHVFAKRNGEPKVMDPNFRNYNISITTLEFVHKNPNYFGPGTMIQLHNFNEYSFRYDIIKTLPAGVKMIVHSFEKNYRGEYVPSITARETLCEEFQKEQQNQPMYRCFHFRAANIQECPFKKGVYSGNHTKCTSFDCPAVLPGHHWRVTKTWITEDDIVLFEVLLEFTINQKSWVPFSHKREKPVI